MKTKLRKELNDVFGDRWSVYDEWGEVVKIVEHGIDSPVLDKCACGDYPQIEYMGGGWFIYCFGCTGIETGYPSLKTAVHAWKTQYDVVKRISN